MADRLHLTVLTPERAVLDEEIYSLVAPGAAGYLGILRNHAPLITTLVPGKLTVKDAAQKPSVYAIGGGFLEVSRNRVTILADTLESVDEIDMSEAVAARDWAAKRVHQVTDPVEKAEATAELARATNRVRVKRNPGPAV